jgi:hypothetical protein
MLTSSLMIALVRKTELVSRIPRTGAAAKGLRRRRDRESMYINFPE